MIKCKEMKTITTYLGLLFCFIQSYAQVGINTTTPNAQLDIRSSNQATPSNTDGLLIPKMDAFPATNPTAAQQGMMVYLTTTSGSNLPGFYYWDFPTLTWIGITSTANGDADWHEIGTTTSPNSITDDMFHMGNVAIGKNTAIASLDILSTQYNSRFFKNKHTKYIKWDN
jgi:trimeric autotransporter adhesin